MVNGTVRKIIVVALALLLIGCSSSSKKEEDTKALEAAVKNVKPVDPINDDAVLQQALARAVQETSTSLSHIAAIEKAQYPHEVKMPFTNISNPALEKKLSLDWYGPVEPILQNVAKAVGYQLQVYGKKPSVPLLVNVSYQESPALVILRNIDLQSRTRAALMILPKKKLISLRYL